MGFTQYTPCDTLFWMNKLNCKWLSRMVDFIFTFLRPADWLLLMLVVEKADGSSLLLLRRLVTDIRPSSQTHLQNKHRLVKPLERILALWHNF